MTRAQLQKLRRKLAEIETRVALEDTNRVSARLTRVEILLAIAQVETKLARRKK